MSPMTRSATKYNAELFGFGQAASAVKRATQFFTFEPSQIQGSTTIPQFETPRTLGSSIGPHFETPRTPGSTTKPKKA